MRKYFWIFNKSPTGTYAEYDHVGSAIGVYLQEITTTFPDLYAYGKARDDLLAALTAAILIHEDFHEEIETEVDTNSGQQHEGVYNWIQDWMNDNDE